MLRLALLSIVMMALVSCENGEFRVCLPQYDANEFICRILGWLEIFN